MIGEDCPQCDHELDEHTTSGCSGYTPTWPRLERCPCRASVVCTCPDYARDTYCDVHGGE